MTDTRFDISINSLQLELNPDNSVPNEVQLLPYGKIKGRDRRKFSMFDVAAVIANTLKWYNPASNSDKLDLVIDYEHQTLFADKNGARLRPPAGLSSSSTKAKTVYGAKSNGQSGPKRPLPTGNTAICRRFSHMTNKATLSP